MIKTALPVIAVSDSVRAEDYYCSLGFQKMFAYRKMRALVTHAISGSLEMRCL